MPLSYSFLVDFAFWKRAGTLPNGPRCRSPLAPAGKQGLRQDTEQLLPKVLTLFLASGVGEGGQKGIDGILHQRETELARRQVQCRSGLLDGGASEIVGGDAEHQL